MFATIQQPLSPVLMSPSVYLSNDHSPRSDSPPSELHFFRFATAESLGSVVVSSGSATISHLNIVVDLSFYPLQQFTNSGSPPSCPIVRQHPVVLCSWLPKTARLTTSDTYEPIIFSDANRYEASHGAMQDEIHALRFNNTWSLDLIHPSKNIVGNCWV